MTRFEDKLDKSMGMKFIVVGLTKMVEEEGYTAHEAISELRGIGQGVFHALAEIKRESETE